MVKLEVLMEESPPHPTMQQIVEIEKPKVVASCIIEIEEEPSSDPQPSSTQPMATSSSLMTSSVTLWSTPSAASAARSVVSSAIESVAASLSDPKNIGARVAVYLGVATGSIAFEGLLIALASVKKMDNVPMKKLKFLQDESFLYALSLVCIAFSWICSIYVSIKPKKHPSLKRWFFFASI